MFKQKKWPFTGASGTEYVFSILRKSDRLPQSPGVFILAYTHPRGHLAGWEVKPLRIGQSDDISASLERETGLDADQKAMWNSVFVLPEPDANTREACVRDLNNHSMKTA